MRTLIGLVATLLLTAPGPAFAQGASGSAAGAVAGGTLGAYSGAILGTVGSILPCSQTYAGAACVRWSAIVGGSIGAAAGALLGAHDDDQLSGAAVGTGVGFLVGVAGGIGVKALAQRVGWEDVVAIGLMGGAVGSVPLGSVIGLGIGSGLGGLFWVSISGFGAVDAVSISIAGMAIGGIVQWVVDGVGASLDEDMQVALPVRIRFE